MPFKPSKRYLLFSGNGNKPNASVKLGLFQLEIHIHDMKSVFQVLLGVVAFVVWLKRLETKKNIEV